MIARNGSPANRHTNHRTMELACSAGASERASKTIDVLAKGFGAFRFEVRGMCIHPGNPALAVFDSEFGFAACLADHPFPHEPIVHLRIADPQLFAGGIGFIEVAFIDQADHAVREPVELGC